jgi:hypothetical protein
MSSDRRDHHRRGLGDHTRSLYTAEAERHQPLTTTTQHSRRRRYFNLLGPARDFVDRCTCIAAAAQSSPPRCMSGWDRSIHIPDMRRSAGDRGPR